MDLHEHHPDLADHVRDAYRGDARTRLRPFLRLPPRPSRLCTRGRRRNPQLPRLASEFPCDLHECAHREILAPLLHPLQVRDRDPEQLGKLRLRPSVGGSKFRDSSAYVADDRVRAGCAHMSGRRAFWSQ